MKTQQHEHKKLNTYYLFDFAISSFIQFILDLYVLVINRNIIKHGMEVDNRKRTKLKTTHTIFGQELSKMKTNMIESTKAP